MKVVRILNWHRWGFLSVWLQLLFGKLFGKLLAEFFEIFPDFLIVVEEMLDGLILGHRFFRVLLVKH